MKTEITIRQLTEEISSYKFTTNATTAQFDWLIARCELLVRLLESDGAAPELINRMKEIGKYLAAQSREVTHDLVRQQTLVFQQDAIVYHLMKQGYAKMIAI